MLRKRFYKYISLNILGMVGLSCYILADSYFISEAEGANGLTALNLVLPIYNLIFAIGAMIGVGTAIKYVIKKSEDENATNGYFFNALFFSITIGLIFFVIDFLFAEQILQLLGADKEILQVGLKYTRIFMAFAPVFMCNYVFNAFVRNDGAPFIAMLATLISSLFNIIFDYVLMFPLNMGMSGAALATALSPIVGICICSIHIFSKKSNVKICFMVPDIMLLIKSCAVGASAFIGEISSGVITMSFNFIILKLSGNVGVAAYGVVANVALVAISVFNGVAQGSQPIISESFARGKLKDVTKLRNMCFTFSIVSGMIMYAILFVNVRSVANIFNSEHNLELEAYAMKGIKLYFTALVFVGLNITASSYFSAIEKVVSSFIISILRGFVLILLCAFIMSWLFGMNGVWLSYAVAEGITMIVMAILVVM